MHQTQFSQKIPYGGFSQIRSQLFAIGIKFYRKILIVVDYRPCHGHHNSDAFFLAYSAILCPCI